MAKVDLTRDYYADLELQPGASEGDIKKQFKKLALRYHPDRNPGREAEVNSKFVTIQLAHEVLTDPEQRAKYDAARARAPPIRAYGGFTTTPSSGTKGNPWASAGAQWAPPPKPPPPKDAERRKAPPTSAGAQRYSQFTAPNGAVPKTRQDPEASRTNYKAWESMKGPAARAYQPPPTPKPVPKEYAYQSGREESNSFKHPPPPRSSRPGHDEFRASTASESARTSPSREKSSNAPPKRNGYMPTTSSAGDEPPASSSSAYFTRRAGRASTSGPAAPPEPPPRNVPSADPFRQFREKTGAPLEPRLSTPYATHGGEKTNPFESINLSRSRSTREPSGRGGPANAGPAFRSASGERVRSASPPRARRHRAISPEPGITRADSDIHLGASPKRTFSHANRNAWPGGSSRGYARYTPPAGSGTSSNGDDSDSELNRQSFGTRSRTYAKRRAAQASARAKDAQGPPGGPEGINTPSGEQPPDAHPHNHEERGSDSSRKEEPSMYDAPQFFNPEVGPTPKKASPLATILEEADLKTPAQVFPTMSSNLAASSEAFALFDQLMGSAIPAGSRRTSVTSPAEASFQTPPHVLNPFEAVQQKLVDEIVTFRVSASRSKATSTTIGGHRESNSAALHDQGMAQVDQVPSAAQGDRLAPGVPSSRSFRSAAPPSDIPIAGRRSPFKRHKRDNAFFYSSSSSDSEPQIYHGHDHARRANRPGVSSFSFNVDDNTFQSPRPSDKAFTSNSAENISTKFTPEDWHGKFEAGDYFANDPRSSKGASRTRSGSRTGTRSPVKGRPASKSQTNVQPPIPNIDPEILSQAPPDPEPATASPSDTKFTAEEWARTFKPQNFAPPPFPSPNPSGRPPYPSRTPRRSKTGSSVKASNTAPAAGTADAVSKEDSSDDTPLYMGTRPAATPRTAQAGPAAGFESPNAMDIDPPSEPQSDPGNGRRESGYAAFQKAANDARNVPLEPSRAEWRAGDSSGTDAPPRAPPPPPPPREPGLPPRSPNPNQSRRRTTKSADEEDFKTNFEDLKNVAPLYHPATGLQSFADITSTLPFPSRAASTLTIPRDLKSGELDLPRPPRAPMVPPIPSGSARPSQSSWISYVVAFKAYMADWDIFNTKMVAHFVARRNQFGLLKPGWLEAFGDTDLKRYRDSLKEDVRIREYCTVAAEHHASAIDQFHNFKNAMR